MMGDAQNIDFKEIILLTRVTNFKFVDIRVIAIKTGGDTLL
jgi:hypothetical protein